MGDTSKRGLVQTNSVFLAELVARINMHRANLGAKLLRAVNRAGIRWEVVRTWTVRSQELERQLKSLKNSPRLCPVCNLELAGSVQNEYAVMKWEFDQSVYNPELPLPWSPSGLVSLK